MSLRDLFRKAMGRPANRAHVDRAPRIRTQPLHDVNFIASEPKFSSPLKVENISATGLGLILPADADVTTLSTIIGSLHFADSDHALTVRLVRFHGDFVGVQIEASPPTYPQALQHYFESEIEALRLRSTNTAVLKPSANGTPHWYQGSNNCDLTYVSNGSDVVEFSLTVFGNHLEGGRGRPLRQSEISIRDSSRPNAYKSADLLDRKRSPDDETLTLAKRVLYAVEGLPSDHRDALLSYLSSRVIKQK